jgi:DNA-binding cell septation regulator SpoVG
MRIKSVSAKRFFKTLALGSAIAVAAVGLPFAAAAPANAVDPVVTTASVTSNTFAVSKVGSSYKIALDLNDAKYSNKTVNVYVTRIVYGQKIVVASRTVKLGTGAVGSTTTTRKIKTGDTIKVTKGSLVVFTRKITSVGLGDVIHPTLSITDNINGLATGAINYTFTFSEAVTGFSADDVTVVGGTKGTPTGAAGGTTYGLIVTPLADSTATITVDVAANSVTDLAKNGNVAAAQNVQLVNTHNPAIVITDDNAGTIHANDQVTFTFTFNQPVTGFDISDVTLVHGNKGAFVAVSSTVYTLVVTAAANFSGRMTVDVAAGVATSSATSATNLAAVQAVQDVNTFNPTVTITDDNAGTVNAGQVVTYRFTFSEAVSGFTTGDVRVVGGTKGLFTAVSTTVYTLPVTPNDNSNTSMTVDVDAAAANSIANNNPTAVATQNVQPVDTRHIVATITDSTFVDWTNATSVQSGVHHYTVVFGEAVSGFTASDITVSGGSVPANFTGSLASYSFDTTVNPGLVGNLVVSIAAGSASSNLTNNQIAAASDSRKFDLVHPLVKLATDTTTALSGSTSALITVTFSKSVSGFVAGDITVGSGGVAETGTFAGSGSSYTMSVHGDGSTTSFEVSVASGVATDGTNTNVASVAIAQLVGGPTVVITGATTASGVYALTITFSSTVSNFIRSDITVSGVAAAGDAVLTGSGTTYTLTVTEAASATVAVSVSAGVATAVNGVGNSASNTVTTVVTI